MGLEELKLLIGTRGGLVGSAPLARHTEENPGFVFRTVRFGDIGEPWAAARNHSYHPMQMRAGGAGINEEEALTRALAEAVERYSAGIYRERDLISACGNEVQGEALDLDMLPRCSARELGSGNCPICVPDKRKPIRWVRGVSLVDGTVCLLPAVMAFSGLRDLMPGERFWFQTSTGCAAHSTYEDALVAAICELVERDALSVNWLQRLPRARIEVDVIPEDLRPYWERYSQSSADLSCEFYDFTSEIGIPTVYGVQLAPNDPNLATIVSCSTQSSFGKAIAKVMLDLYALRIALRNPPKIPKDWNEFVEPMHGAAYMANAKRKGAFSFLTASNRNVSLACLSDRETRSSLSKILKSFFSNGHPIYAVDLSTDEALRAGMRVVRVIAPTLQPVSFRHRARFLGHARLYEAPSRLGYRSLKERSLNKYPQPFA